MVQRKARVADPPKLGLSHNAKHEYQWWDGQNDPVGPLTSVTTALGVIAKPALINWMRLQTASAAIRNAEAIPGMVSESGVDATARWLISHTDHKKSTAGDLGTRVHQLAERVIAGEPYVLTDDERPYVNQFVSWVEDTQPEFIHTEIQVCNLRVGYAGTLDAIARMDGYTYLLDFKTGKGVYPEYALQLAAYKNAEFWANEGEDYKFKMPGIDRCAVLHLQPDGWALVPMRVGPQEWRAFRAALELWTWVNGPGKEVVG